MDAIAETRHIGTPLAGLMSRVRELIDRTGAHPARTVVLMPFVHVLNPAREAWAGVAPQGFVPRFETTSTWSAGAGFEPGVHDYAGELARDLLAARSLLERAGLGANADLLAPRLAQAAGQLAGPASAVEPAARGAWAARARHSLSAAFDAPVLAHEAAVASIAVEWVAASAFATDGLFEPAAATELLIVVQALRDDPLPLALARAHGDRAHVLRLDGDGTNGAIALHAATDPADEAERACACVLRHVREGRVPVALAAVDRLLTRRIRALLEQGHAAIRDETGWKLSTTRAGAHVMLALRAAMHGASSDAVIDWLKNSPVHATASVLALERRVRRNGTREWHHVLPSDLGDGQQAIFEFVRGAREAMREPRPLPQWLAQWRSVLQGSGQWRALEDDAAGQQAIAALRLAETGRAEFEAFPPARRRMGLAEFLAWANDILETENFRPPGAADAQVVILPFHQLVGRPFAALVMPGCEEARLPASPEPAGVWTPAQREALGLPTRAALERETRMAWQQALQAPHVDILWRCADDSGEKVLPATLVQELVLAQAARPGIDPRESREVIAQPTSRPLPCGQGLPLESLSASAYDDLRKCPYRFFALRQLSLQEPDEIDVDVDKRDFGNWLHRVLNVFHGRLAQDPGAPRRELLDGAATQVTCDMRLDEGEFLPFQAAWTQAREGYLAWLAKHEADEGATFQAGESPHTRAHAGLQLVGRIDRIDTMRSGGRMVMDYKTESLAASQARVKNPGEDTQLAFYAALLGDDDLRAAYVNIGERGETKTVEQHEVAAARELLLAGIAEDFRRIQAGAQLPALGEGKACDFCAARGLCRKDFWA